MKCSDKISEIRRIRVTTGWDCNLDCHYCSQRHSLSSLKAKDNGGYALLSLYGLLKNFESRLVHDGELAIELEGGEPLLHPEILVGAVKLAGQLRTEARNISYWIFTNARLLNEENARELIRWIHKRGKLIIAPSFDHNWKHPAKLSDDTYCFMEKNSERVFGTYVVEGKHVLKDAKENISYLNRRGIIPRVLWNFFAYDELSQRETRQAFLSLLHETNTQISQGWEGTVERCGWIGISPRGSFYPCYQSVLGNIDLSVGRAFEKEHCISCRYRDYCRQCLARKAYFKNTLCDYIKVVYAAEHGTEVE